MKKEKMNNSPANDFDDFPAMPPPKYPAIMAGLWPDPVQSGYTADQLRDYVLLDRAQRSAKATPTPRGDLTSLAPLDPAKSRLKLYMAAIDCGHEITNDMIILYRDPDCGGNALSQLGDRLDAVTSKASIAAQTTPSDSVPAAVSNCITSLEVEMVQYEHGKGGPSFKQYAKDPIPKWAFNVRPYTEAVSEEVSQQQATVLDLKHIALDSIHEAYLTAFGPLNPNVCANDIDAHIRQIIANEGAK